MAFGKVASIFQRWEVRHPDAPDGIAIIGFGSNETPYLQRYFDSRGVSTWHGLCQRCLDTPADCGEHPDFSQRFSGHFSEDGCSIAGGWETSYDNGSHWSADFDLTYTRVK